ncbi:hypothetical protein Moror_10000 [Moniliophthora roreri MCA 2997]|uniref:DUF6534 domain-containing protein n=1 Tax=Moniliophthora roreri (strain MCA 2997) TaxID=1381753 RepID=V2WYG0_MONRO|nr:hypothetical protein Moror_10000 [Moniliophthora roreri MCA 2997]
MAENISHLTFGMITSAFPSRTLMVVAIKLLGYMLNWGLYGVLSVQVYMYWTVFPNDSRPSRALVYGIYLLETAQTILLTHDAFQTFVFGFMDPASVDNVYYLWLDVYLFDALVALFVQVYYAHRTHVLLSRSRLLPAIIVSLSIIQFISAVLLCAAIKRYRYFSAYQTYSTSADSVVSGFLWIVSATIADILIAITMVYALSRYDTTFKETQSLVRRLNRLAMETCSLVAATQIAQPFLFYFFPGRNYQMTPGIIIAKLYSNSLLVVFNSRIQIHGARGNRRVSEETNWRTSIRVTANHRGLEVPLSTRSWVPSTFPGSLSNTDSSGLTGNTLETKTESRIAETQSEGLATLERPASERTEELAAM